MNRPTLVVLAAGMGSRYGGLKQLDRLGFNDETILDYTIYDAVHAGFEKIVFVIRKNIEAEFKECFIDKLTGLIEVEYVFQELENVPKDFIVPDDRVKPWGTAHAVLMAKEKISGPFAIVNADDFYGGGSIFSMFEFLSTVDSTELHACLIGFVLKNTLSDHGRVSRGICEVSNGILKGITERTHIYFGYERPYFVLEDEQYPLTGEEIVSMNLMGFTPLVFPIIERMFTDFLKRQGTDIKAEFFIPSVLNEIQKSGIEVPVLHSDDQYFGVTYMEDKSVVQEGISELIKSGVYPSKLFD